MKKVLLEIDAAGVTKISAEGYEGGTCLDATAIFESMFTKTVQERVMVGECSRKDDGERVFNR